MKRDDCDGRDKADEKREEERSAKMAQSFRARDLQQRVLKGLVERYRRDEDIGEELAELDRLMVIVDSWSFEPGRAENRWSGGWRQSLEQRICHTCADPLVRAKSKRGKAATQVCWWCVRCEVRWGPWEAPGYILLDRLIDVTPNGSRKRCVRCDELGFLEEHHWAPREIFGEEADLFPTDLLCQKCHAHWHAKVNEPRVRRW